LDRLSEGGRVKKVLGIRLGVVVALFALCGALGGALVAYRVMKRRAARRPPPTERALVLAAREARPRDPWPRGEGHVLLAFPGSREEDKAYHEPGGSFSPAVGSFGIAIWSIGSDGSLAATSDSLPMSQVEQRLELSPAGLPPTLVDRTPRYESRWTLRAPGRFTLQLTPQGAGEHVLAIRSVGPAGGPIHALSYEQGQLRINHRWTVRVSPEPTAVRLGEEPTKDDASWRSPGKAVGVTKLHSATGWAYAQLRLAPGVPITAQVEDTRPQAASPLAGIDLAPKVQLTLPDARFADSLHAQAAHLLMSLVGREPRPGEPTNYPLPWLRDGAYTTVALARAGYVELARALVSEFAERDFFGGFGAEGDGPGFGLWVMDEVALRADDPALDRFLYPHAVRKAEFIGKMMEAKHTLHMAPIPGPIVPSLRDDKEMAPSTSVICDAAKDGLIVGRMDGHRPILFINAVNYMGLVRAARIAERMGDKTSATRWLARADKLKQAWRKGFDTPERNNDRTAISTLWPSFIGHDARKEFRALLEERWAAQRTPDGGFKAPREWTYFDAAEMHQWTMLDLPERTWTTLEHYWKQQQASPGLYTWSEGSGEENTFGLWPNVRGWLEPKHVTPHYWTASEMLLLQLDMLAYVEESGSDAIYVLGGGVPKAWLAAPLAVSNVGTSRGVVSWKYDQGKLEATIRGRPGRVRAGSAFGRDVPLEVHFLEPAPVPAATSEVSHAQ
jgi:hypothetical protein